MALRRSLLAWSLLTLLCACSGKPPAPQAPETAKPAPVATPWDDMKKTEQRAADVQKAVDHQAAEQRAQLEQQEH
ncbi:hypothetical protein [Dyella sp.]|jgi:hypothetical protein|uniref:hypothetical protein n=1 Tax=Dyella sp. TaxID=1869338 RepID=UPI002D78B998|nr:hypothetical protein [Dyella sp.]HET6431898.1 hypothetical protein [Dyella sp.]